jgi:glycosyltransferase involved in cell wall biosynthesis
MKIVVDGFFYQLARSGIARVWREMITKWAKLSPDIQFLFLDRGQTDVHIDGVTMVPFQQVPVGVCFEEWSLRAWDEDREVITAFCKEEEVDLFLSTYFTYADGIPNVMMVHDMIPENNPDTINLEEPIWKMKVRTIYAASGYICVSYNTATELYKHYEVAGRNILVAHNGVDTPSLSTIDSSEQFLAESLGVPFVLVPGLASPKSYKNQEFVFRSLKSLLSTGQLRIVVTGKNASTEIQQFEPYCHSDMIESHFLSEEQLDWHYRNALAVIYPSKEEGFGLPIIESLARGALPVTCMNSSLPEVGSANAVYVRPDNELELLEVITYLLRSRSIGASLCDVSRLEQHAHLFQWDHMARRLDAFCRQLLLESRHGRWMKAKGFN